MAKKRGPRSPRNTQDEENNNTSAEEQTSKAIQQRSADNTEITEAEEDNPINQVEDRFEEYYTQLTETDIPKASSEQSAKAIDLESDQYQQNYKICFFKEAQLTNEEYLNFQNRITTTLAKDAEMVSGDVTAAVGLYEELKTALKDAMTAIKEAKQKTNAADDMASIVDDARNDSMYSEEAKALREGLGEKEVTVRGETKKKYIFDLRVNNIVRKSDNVRDTADNAVEAAVKVHGISGFTNVDCMEPSGNAMKEKVQLLKDNIAENLTSSQQKKEDAQTALTSALEATSESDHHLATAGIAHKGLKNTAGFANNPVDPRPTLTLDQISQKVERTFLEQALQK